jgi:hypothetical protein
MKYGERERERGRKRRLGYTLSYDSQANLE